MTNATTRKLARSRRVWDPSRNEYGRFGRLRRLGTRVANDSWRGFEEGAGVCRRGDFADAGLAARRGAGVERLGAALLRRGRRGSSGRVTG